jgi:hypothetical protein
MIQIVSQRKTRSATPTELDLRSPAGRKLPY